MTGRRAVLMITGLLIAGVGVVFLILGLDQADKAASVAGAVVGIAGLGFSIWVYMKNAPLTKNVSKWNHVHVTDSTMVQIGDYGVQEAIFGSGATNSDIGLTQSDDKGRHRDGSESRSGFSALQD